VAEVGGEGVEHVTEIDAEALGDALVRLAHDPERRRALAAAGRARAERFSWTRAASESLAIYREVADTASARTRSRSAVRVGPGSDRGRTEVRPQYAESAEHGVDVLFGQAYFLRFDPKLWAAQQPYAPLGALYAAACARGRGYRVALFDAMLAESEQEWIAALDRRRPRVAVLYEDSFNYLSKMCLLRTRAGSRRSSRDRMRAITPPPISMAAPISSSPAKAR
jgi:hypothetical protein